MEKVLDDVLGKATTTSAERPNEPFTLEKLKEISYHYKMGKQELPTYKKGWFEKLMNKFGWYRQYQVFIIDKDKFGIDYSKSLFNRIDYAKKNG